MVADPAEKDAAHTRQSGVSSPCTHVRLRADQLESSLEFFTQARREPSCDARATTAPRRPPAARPGA